MKKTEQRSFALFLLTLTAALALGSAARMYASGTDWRPMTPPAAEQARPAEPTAESLYKKGQEADKAGDNKAALKYFQQALKLDNKNPDIINMLAHSERKLGMLNEAITDYWTALKIRPHFPEAREYMGEAYIQAALKEIETLKSYGEEGKEQREDLAKAFKDAAAGLEAGPEKDEEK